MTQPILLTGQVYASQLPDDATKIKIDGQKLIWFLGNHPVYDVRVLPSGNWQLIGTTKEVTEEVAEQIVQVISNGKISGRPQYRRYDRDPVKDTPARSWTRDPRHSFETLLTSNGLDNTKNYVLIKKL